MRDFPLLPGQQERELRLKRMKRIPLILLGLMIALFVATLHHPAAWAGWVHAFAEAGMVGALADWFAVVALFRHPLGIPIPHTAIIPTRKDELGDAMARFIDDHFLDPDVVRRKLENVDLAELSLNWLRSEKGQQGVLDGVTGLLRWGLEALDEQRVRRFLSRLGRKQLAKVSLAPFAGHTIEWLVRDGRHQDILTQVLRYAIVLINEHRETIRERVQQESPWWIPGFIDDRILKQMLERVETQLFEMTLDENHAMRLQFHQWLEGLAHRLKTDPEHREFGEAFKRQVLENESLQDYLYNLWRELADRLEQDLGRSDSMIRASVSGWLETATVELQADEAMQAWINQWLGDAIVAVVENNSRQISSLISDTVRTWDGRETSYRVELAIGRDLQFIRINGTLVGGLVGLVIHAITLA